MNTNYSICYCSGNRDVVIMTSSVTFGSTEIHIGTADAPQGPWTFFKAWDYPDYVKKTKLWGTYHPKAHVTMSRSESIYNSTIIHFILLQSSHRSNFDEMSN